jgi:hypothetical protein
MAVTIKVNGRNDSLVHKGSSHFSKATIPDVCKTPSPGGPVPLPYPNISMSSSLAKGTTTVKADGGNMIAVKGSEFSMSQGDEPGTAGGVKSSTFKKESTWITYSFDVKIEGKNACRLSDKKFQNHENTVDMGGAGGITVEAIAKFTKMLCKFLKECTEAHDKGTPPDKARCDAPGAAPPDTYAMDRGTAIDKCCKEKIEAKKPKGSVVRTDRWMEVPGWGGSCQPDVVVGSPPCHAVYDFKTSCPPSKPKPDWPIYGNGPRQRRTQNLSWHQKSQADVYQRACGKRPTMIHAKSPECNE